MKLKNLAVALAFATATFGGFQTACGYGQIQIPFVKNQKLPSPGGWTPIPIDFNKSKGDEKFNLKPQPGYEVTLLPNQKVHFAWSNNNAKKFVIHDEKGKKVFECNVTDKDGLDIVPSTLKQLKIGEKYFWNLDGKRNYEFTILDNTTEKAISEKLAEIDAKNLPSDECVLEKATYLLRLSDEYPDTFDFYWLIAQWLEEISPTDKKIAEKKSEFLLRCSRHLDDES